MSTRPAGPFPDASCASSGHPLTPKQQRFVEEYLCDLNATQAAIRAGYSAKTANEQAARLLANVSVAQAIAERQSERGKRLEITQDYVVANLTEVVERCMQRAPVTVRRGREVVQLKDDEGRGVWRFDASGSIGALSKIGQHLGMFVEKHEHTGKNGGPIEIASAKAELARRIAEIRDRRLPATHPRQQ